MFFCDEYSMLNILHVKSLFFLEIVEIFKGKGLQVWGKLLEITMQCSY